MADACVLIEEHVLLHALVLGANQLFLQGVDRAHHAVLEQVLEDRGVDVLLCRREVIQVQLWLRLRAQSTGERALRAATSKAWAASPLDIASALRVHQIVRPAAVDLALHVLVRCACAFTAEASPGRIRNVIPPRRVKSIHRRIKGFKMEF